jgi:hypothetical protein
LRFEAFAGVCSQISRSDGRHAVSGRLNTGSVQANLAGSGIWQAPEREGLPSFLGDREMRSWRIWCLVLGIGSFLLPLAGLQFVLLDIFGGAQWIVGGLLAVVGAVLVAVSFAKGDRQ